MAQTYNLEIDEETDFSVRFVYTELSTGLPYDLTGATADMQVRRLYNGVSDPEVKMSFSTTDGSIVVGGETGLVDVFIPYTATKGKDWESGVYALFITTAEGKRVCFMTGFFTIIPNAVHLT